LSSSTELVVVEGEKAKATANYKTNPIYSMRRIRDRGVNLKGEGEFVECLGDFRPVADAACRSIGPDQIAWVQPEFGPALRTIRP
jgi:hypothetical protein